MPLPSVEPQRLYRQIAEQLRTRIVDGEFTPGSRMPAERDLAQQLGVSRPSVREALIALEVEGVIDVRTGSGIYVLGSVRARATQAARPRRRQRTTADDAPRAAAPTDEHPDWGPLEVMRARGVVESEVAALAAKHARRADLQAMAHALAQMRAEADTRRGPRRGDEAFHMALASACGNDVLRDTVAAYWRVRDTALFERLGDHFENPPSWRAALAEHEAVLDAIRARDAAAARSAMQLHLKKAHNRYSASWRRANVSRQSSISLVDFTPPKRRQP